MDKVIHKLHETYYGTKCAFHTGKTETLKTICFAYFHCVMKYTLIMWGFHITVNRHLLYNRND